MYSHDQLIEFHVEAQQIKEHQWYEHGEPDMYPMLVVRWRDMMPQSVDAARVGGIIEQLRDWALREKADTWLTRIEMNAPLIVYSCLAALKDNVPLPGLDHMPPDDTPMESVWLAVEGYSFEGSEAEADEVQRQRGDLERDYKTNPASKVLERLTTYQVETSSTGLAEWGRVTSAFHKDDGGRIVWHEPYVDSSDEPPEGGFDRLLEIMIPHVTREKLA